MNRFAVFEQLKLSCISGIAQDLSGFVDVEAEQDGDLRIVDESGEDYLFSAECFELVKLPQTVENSLLKAA
jgi:hypothetical protein